MNKHFVSLNDVTVANLRSFDTLIERINERTKASTDRLPCENDQKKYRIRLRAIPFSKSNVHIIFHKYNAQVEVLFQIDHCNKPDCEVLTKLSVTFETFGPKQEETLMELFEKFSKQKGREFFQSYMTAINMLTLSPS